MTTPIITKREYIIDDAPFGKFTVAVEITETTPAGFFRKESSETYRRYIDQWGRLAFPWWECAKFDTRSEAKRFLEWAKARQEKKS